MQSGASFDADGKNEGGGLSSAAQLVATQKVIFAILFCLLRVILLLDVSTIDFF